MSYFRIVLCLLAIFLFFGYASSANEDLEALKMSKSSPVMEGLRLQENLCLKAAIHSNVTALSPEALSILNDGDKSWGIDISALKENPLAIVFTGRPPWVTSVVVTKQGNVDIELTFKDLEGLELRPVYMIREDVRSGGAADLIFEFEPIRVTALVIEAFGDGSVAEVESYFAQADTDDGLDEIITEWVEKYKGTPCGGKNSKDSRKSAHGLANQLVSRLGWMWRYDWGNSLAWEQDFTREGNFWDIDQVDLVFFKGHGNAGLFAFSHKFNDCYVFNTECTREWGETDLEWAAFSSCKVLAESAWDNWHRVFDRLHLICGMKTNIRSAALGGEFGKQLAKYKRTFPSSWFKAVKKLHRPWWWWLAKKKRRTAVVMAEVYDNFNDHAWGAGYVSPDPTYNSIYWTWTYTFKGIKDDGPILFDPYWATTIAYPDQGNTTFLVPEQILARSPGAAIPLQIVSPLTVDTSYVRALADDFCTHYSIFCSTPILYDDTLQVYSTFDGAHELYVDIVSGGWDYMNSSTYATPVGSAPSIISEGQASDSLFVFMSNVGFLPSERTEYDAAWLYQSAVDDETGAEDSTMDLTITNGYARTIDGYAVAGPGGHIAVDFGDGGEVQSAEYNGWRDVTAGASISSISLQDALDDLAYSGPEITIGGMPDCDEFLVDTAVLGYYEPASGEIAAELPIVWMVYGYCVNEELNDTSECEILIPAEYRHPRSEILNPPEDITIPAGQGLTLQGTASGGNPPYVYEWYSDVDGHVGSDSALTIPPLSVLAFQPETSHTIMLEVTDANGAVDYDYVVVTVQTETGKIPTLSEWGLIIFSLLILTLITTVVVKRRMAGIGAGGDMTMPISGPLFFPAQFIKSLTMMLGAAGVILIAATLISGSIPIRDIVGTILSAGIVAYIVHLWIVSSRSDD
jgi:hypothetical protein